jgi:predicted component of type VI protein secretion system
LLRLPYGQQTDPIDSFAFEEMPAGAAHADYLWGNPAGACAELIGRAFLGHGRPAPLAAYRELEDLPAHVVPTADGTRLQACAEVVLSETAAQAMLARGVMPLLSYRNRNAVRLWRWQSLAHPPAMLAGPWA